MLQTHERLRRFQNRVELVPTNPIHDHGDIPNGARGDGANGDAHDHDNDAHGDDVRDHDVHVHDDDVVPVQMLASQLRN